MGARRAAAAIERGSFAGPITRAIATALSPLLAHALVRPARVPIHVRLICVGGATLGGSGKSRLANACAHELKGSILVGHGYRARDRRTRFVAPTESVASAGDEALVAARRGLRVVIGPTRQAAIDFAANHSDLLILDGPLRVTEPPPTLISLLAVDADEPWGCGEMVPAGDLRASRETLLALADHVVSIPRSIPTDLPPRPFGLFTALARPERLVRALRPDVVFSVADHGARRGVVCLPTHEVTRWVATEKCALHLEGQNLPVQVLPDTYIGCLDRLLRRRIVSSIDCERTGREDTSNDHRPEAGR